LCKETQTISLAGKKLLAIFNTGQTQQTTETFLPSRRGLLCNRRCVAWCRRIQAIFHPHWKSTTKTTK
jgi:hypothetical protein